jgi:hypothetical protein
VEDALNVGADFAADPIAEVAEQGASLAGRLGAGGVEDALNVGSDLAKDPVGTVIDQAKAGIKRLASKPTPQGVTAKKRARQLIQKNGGGRKGVRGALREAQNPNVRKILKAVSDRLQNAKTAVEGTSTSRPGGFDETFQAPSNRTDQGQQPRQGGQPAQGGQNVLMLVGLALAAIFGISYASSS